VPVLLGQADSGPAAQDRSNPCKPSFAEPAERS